MIWESFPWREQLLKDACALKRHAQTKRITEKRSMLIERSVFLSAYAMRRLDDAKKLSTSWSGSAVKGARHASLRKVPNLLSWHCIEELYDLSKSASLTMSARHFCDLIIHSYIFLECIRDDRSVKGIFIASDKKKREALWFFTLDTVAGLMERTSLDDPSHLEMTYDQGAGEWAVQAAQS